MTIQTTSASLWNGERKKKSDSRSMIAGGASRGHIDSSARQNIIIMLPHPFFSNFNFKQLTEKASFWHLEEHMILLPRMLP